MRFGVGPTWASPGRTGDLQHVVWTLPGSAGALKLPPGFHAPAPSRSDMAWSHATALLSRRRSSAGRSDHDQPVGDRLGRIVNVQIRVLPINP